MAINELIVRKPANATLVQQGGFLFDQVPNIMFELADPSRYTFEYKVNDNIDVNMFESDRMPDSDDFVDAEFDSTVNERDYSYYSVAAASGVLTGFLSQLKLSEETLSKIKSWNNKDWEKYLVIVAQIAGYKKSDLKNAVDYLKDRFGAYASDELKTEIRAGQEACLLYLSNHPSLAGLVFSVFTQFGEERYIFGDTELNKEDLPEYYALGSNSYEKVVYGFLYWVFGIAAEVAVSKRGLLDDMKIPREVIRLLKELCKLPAFASIPQDYDEAEKLFSEWLQKTFHDSAITDEEGNTVKFDLQSAVEDLPREISGNLPVLLNECIVRAFYVVKKLRNEIKEKDILSFADFQRIDVNNVLPFNNRLITRMVFISSGCFVGVNVAGATVKAIKSNSKKKGDFAKTLLTEINVIGIGRFIFACVADSKYWSDDIQVLFTRKGKGKKGENVVEEEKIADDMMENEALKVLRLTPMQARALHSLEAVMVLKDIEHSHNESEKEKKQRWLKIWKERIIAGLDVDFPDYFCTDEEAIYRSLCSVEQTKENLEWFYLMTMELVVFKPYYPLGVAGDTEFKKLKLDKYNYIDDQFARRQTVVSQTEIDSIRDAYKKYKNIISGTTQNSIIAAGVTTVTAVATGGLALAFAPGIATLIAGEAVIGLHGAALTSASLAFVGGGSLAAGGLGMAGGTAIITGGGALLGMAGSGSASMAAILSQTSGDLWIRQSTKLLVYSKCILKECLINLEAVEALIREVTRTIKQVENNVKELDGEKCSLDRDALKNSKDCLKYLTRCKNEMEKLIADKAK